MKTNQQWNAKVANAAKLYPKKPNKLRRLVRRLRQLDTLSHCRQSAKILLKHEPNSKVALTSLIYFYATNQDRPNLRNSLDLARQSSDGETAKFQRILKGVENSLTDGNRETVERMLAEAKCEAVLIRQRQQRYKTSNQQLAQRKRVVANNCDLICIASNEGPYIAEFIHHYLYQGFSDIFIGLNNDTSGLTGPIVEAIAAQYPQVHLLNTDQEHQRDGQRGCYCRLYQEAAKISTASHCMVADIDEFWVAYPFSNGINNFLKGNTKADVVSFNWLHCHGGESFGNPLDLANTKLRVTAQFKSLFRYGTAITDLGGHAPWVLAKPTILHTSSDGQKIASKAFNGVRRLKKGGIQAKTDQPNTGWMIHRLIRSELEYVSKLLYPRNKDVSKMDAPFKTNRNGFITTKEGIESRQLAYNIFGTSSMPPQDYINSLETYIQRCGISEALKQARSTISEEAILKKIDAIPAQLVHNNKEIWQRSFRRTRFLDILEARANEHKTK